MDVTSEGCASSLPPLAPSYAGTGFMQSKMASTGQFFRQISEFKVLPGQAFRHHSNRSHEMHLICYSGRYVSIIRWNLADKLLEMDNGLI